ncbi:hypothetical protein ACE1B6_08605 [Aerosakkonemataceae cyanobacterium BLCC-F154]|uniref:Type II toxin-antitoxin system HicB family antitoxin n=1 Tax=Floridaenema fluviatile BLCC-F154 TaxID=3153640 RepID=A0ABV4Y955_9CYAN
MQISIANQFTIATKQENDGRWIAEILEIPDVLVYSLTEQEAIKKVKALALKVINNELAVSQLVELRKKIAQGEEQIRQGKVVDGEVVFQQLQEKLEQMEKS